MFHYVYLKCLDVFLLFMLLSTSVCACLTEFGLTDETLSFMFSLEGNTSRLHGAWDSTARMGR